MTTRIIDDTTQAPRSSVVFVLATFEDGSQSAGSGVIVGDNDVLTAQHVIRDPIKGEAVAVQVIPGLDGRDGAKNFIDPLGAYNAVDIEYLPVLVDENNDNRISIKETAFDVALLSFAEDIGVTIGQMRLDPHFTGGDTFLTGYPASNPAVQRYLMAESESFVSATATEAGALGNGDHDVYSGNSGGPLWYQDSHGAFAVGLVSTVGYAFNIGYVHYDRVLGWIEGNDSLMGATVTGPAGTQAPDRLIGGNEGDWLHGYQGDDTLIGGAGDDELLGGKGADRLEGGAGNDFYMQGGMGNDTLLGGSGDDELRGGKDDDLLNPGSNSFGGRDVLYTGLGRDTVYFAIEDAGDYTIMDFDAAADRLQFERFSTDPAANDADILLALSQDSTAGALIPLTADADTPAILLAGLALTDLDAGNFGFGSLVL